MITNKYSGVVGPAVMTINGHMRKRPDFSERNLTPEQLKHLSRFEDAKQYGRIAVSDPEMNAWYASLAAGREGMGAWQVAIMDYFRRPGIVAVSFGGFGGKPGDAIAVEVWDVFMVKSVSFCFTGGGIGLIEKGRAVYDSTNMVWMCRPECGIELRPGLKFMVQALDMPGNVVQMEFEYPFVSLEKASAGQEAPGPSKKKYEKSRLRHFELI